MTTGAEDFLLHVAVPEKQALYSLVIETLTERAEIADVRTSVVHEHIVGDVIA
ncbi:Lrp/AsnC ligand binding domain-containing protein [Pseudonocardia sp. RS11V-5]|uniref:Lrp/AsnC ligand binding domain-containing protein n=1 Tax=Pseudonocardia terrae TaxID=2905831 RepID=UPI001E5645AD|nr:Lrp/AsnC ligand binding domain-containing protein [Pseudonocardia terrae]MCE3555724.1 Lrp/AsnC ligand binding domain-containing protein [Pseudonocardia terrae]